jgi:hypothetical protein
MTYNWGVDTTRLKKNKKAYQKWETEQLVNFGLGGEKISKKYLKVNFNILNFDLSKSNFLKFLLWPNRS